MKFVAKSLLVAVACAPALALSVGFAASEKKAKYTTKEVMVEAHKKLKLNKKIISGTATKDEKLKALDLYTALWSNEPKKGDKAHWKMLTGDLMAAVCRVVLEDEGAVDQYRAAINCKGCHDAHK